MVAPGWLVARPIAHRGLHGGAEGLVENSLGAARAAIAHGFSIECDVQITADGEAVVFHDFDLDRLTGAKGPLVERDAAALAGLAYLRGGETIPTLAALLRAIDGRVPLVCEIKSRFDGDTRLADRALAVAKDYGGPLAFKSFDPAVIAHLRPLTPRPLGLVAEASYDDPDYAALPAPLRREFAALAHFGTARPDFLSYNVHDLPHAATVLCRAFGLPVMTWTVRAPGQVAAARRWADQIVFEGFLP